MPAPQSMTTLALADVIGRVIPWRGPMTGNDAKLCDATFSPWDWIAGFPRQGHEPRSALLTLVQ